jgi:hypothetical protein
MQRVDKKNDPEKRRTYNERFCVIAAVILQIMQCKLASYYPAGSSVEAATTQSRHYVRRQQGQRGGQRKKVNFIKTKI